MALIRVGLLFVLGVAGTACSQGPDMDPGQSCITGGCHRRFTAAGTVYLHADSISAQGAANVLVTITDADGRQVMLTSNEVGNFWTDERLTFPWTTDVQLGSVVRHMTPLIDRGSCNECHTQPPTNGAAGLAYVEP
jgi:hypothetical protein